MAQNNGLYVVAQAVNGGFRAKIVQDVPLTPNAAFRMSPERVVEGTRTIDKHIIPIIYASRIEAVIHGNNHLQDHFLKLSTRQ